MLLEKIRADMTAAMKARDQARLPTLRMIVAAAMEKDMGRVMKAVMDKHKGRVDGKAVNKIVASKLA